MSTPHTVRLVTKSGTSDMTLEHFSSYCGLRGWKIVGVNTSCNIQLREEIEGQPIIDKLCGPMYGGDGIVRYEDSETYDLMST